MSELDLSQFGWAPGLYRFKCTDVDHADPARIGDGAKLSWRCRECAEKRFHEANSSANLTSSGVKQSLTTDAATRFLEEAAEYFANRPTGGEDRAHWANVYNAENCRKAADRITALEAENKALREAMERLLDHEIAHVGPYAGQKVIAARALLAKEAGK